MSSDTEPPKPTSAIRKPAIKKPFPLLYRIAIFCALVLLVVGGYFASEWLKGKVLDAVEVELSRSGVSNLEIEGGSLRWMGADIHSLSFDIENSGLRYSVSLSDIVVQSSIEALQQRKIDRIDVDRVDVLIRQTSIPQASQNSTPFQAKTIPIPSDLFLLLPIDIASVQHFSIQHQLDEWRIDSVSELSINREELQVDVNVHKPSYPVVKIGVKATVDNQLLLNVEPELTTSGPLVITLKSQLDKQYENLAVQLSADVQVSHLRAFFSIEPLIALIENKDYLQQGQEVIADMEGSISLTGDFQLPFASLRENFKTSTEHLAGIPSLLEGMASAEFELSRQELPFALQGTAQWNAETHLLDFNVKELSAGSASIQEQLDRLDGNNVMFTGGRMISSVEGSVNSDELRGLGGDNPSIPSLLLKGQLHANDISLSMSDFELTSLQANTSFNVAGPRLKFMSDVRSLEKVTYGITLHSLESSFSGEGGLSDGSYNIALKSLNGNLLGGTLSLLPFSMTGPELNTEFEVQLNNIDLSEVLALQANEELTGKGELTGFLQVTVKESMVEINEGHMSSGTIDSKEVAGSIQYKRNSGSDALAASDPTQQVGFLLKHMEDFHYTSLETGVALSAPDDLLLSVSLRGGNPDFEEGRAVHLNLNLEQNINPLIQALGIDRLLNNELLK